MNITNFFLDLKLTNNKIIYLIYFLPISLMIGSLAVNINVLILVLFFLYEIIKKKKFNFFIKKDLFFFIAIFVYLILNSIFLAQNLDSFIRAIGFFRFFILVFALVYYFNIENCKYEKKILKAWSIVFFIITLDLIFEFFYGCNILCFESTDNKRLASFTGDEMKIGGYYFGFYLITLSFIFRKNKKMLFYVFFLFFFTIAFLIGERSNFVKIIFISYFFFIILIETKLLNKLIILILPIIIITSVINFNQNLKNKYYLEIIKPILTNEYSHVPGNQSITSKYFQHYYSALEIFYDNKLFGVGIKNYRNESGKRYYNNETIYPSSNHPHQIHFELLAELGLVGYLLIFIFLITMLKEGVKIFKAQKNNESLAAILFILATILPLLPSGSFFTTYGATIFWINFSLLIKNNYLNRI
tara:strand:+ start:3254 stop:4498 length:1245 start_codon:yes stop_codon:yes gene_type:complete